MENSAGHNPNRTAAAQKLRDEWAGTIGELCKAGKRLIEIREITGKSHAFIRRIMDENGLKLASEIEADQAPVKQPDPDKQSLIIQNISYSSTIKACMSVSLRRPPWGEIEIGPRDETKPRVPTHMVSRKPGPYERFVAALREVQA